MLQRLSIKQKLILIMLIPLIVVILLSVKLAFDSYQQKSALEKIEKIVVLSTKIGAFVHETQKERGMTAGFLGSKGTKFVDALPKQRELANSKKRILLDYLRSFDLSLYAKEFNDALKQGLDQLEQLDSIRQKVSSQSIPTGQAIGYYTKMNGLFLNVIASAPKLSQSPNLTMKLAAYSNFLLSKERAGIERAVGSNTFARDNFGKGMRVKFNNLVAKQDAYADSFLKIASTDAKNFFKKTMQGNAIDEVNRMRGILLGAQNSGFGVEAKYWFDTITKKINKLKQVEDYLAKEIIESSKQEKSDTFIEMLIFGILTAIGIAITLILARLIAFAILVDVNDVKKGLDDFFAFINYEKDDLALIKVDSKDELGRMSQIINENIEKTKHNIQTDKDLIQDTIHVANRINLGHLSTRIAKNSNNPALNDLKDIINEMLNTMQMNIEKIMSVLSSYSNLDYRSRVDVNLEGTLAKLCEDVNQMGDSITQTLVKNKRNGMILKQNSDTLTSNLSDLSNSATTQAASLEETAASLEELTATLQQNNASTREMAEYGSKVKTSVSTGQDLANKTALAMEEINDQTSAITEAITVIDQIAFQTNILSLNAAVEAATAGEAGKGFAVVAQEVRNLASRSAEAAKEIKELVESAQEKTDDGKNIASSMIEGYNELNSNISRTIELIESVSTSSHDQEGGIVQINDAMSQLDKLTQQNAQSANHADVIAKQTSKISSVIIEDANAKEFDGKDSIELRENMIDLNHDGVERRNVERQLH